MKENRLFNLLCELEAVQKLLSRDGSTLMTIDDRDKIRKIQEEVDILTLKETELYNSLRKELFETKNTVKKEKRIIKKQGVRNRPVFDKK